MCVCVCDCANGCACSQEVCDGKDVSGGLQRGDHSADEQVVHEVRQLRHSVEILQRQNKKLRLFCQALERECQELHTNVPVHDRFGGETGSIDCLPKVFMASAVYTILMTSKTFEST